MSTASTNADSERLTPPDAYEGVRHLSKRLHDVLELLFAQQLGVSRDAYDEHWEALEIRVSSTYVPRGLGEYMVLDYVFADDVVAEALADAEM